MKLWDKGYKIDDAIERFTVGKDKELDLLLATHDTPSKLENPATTREMPRGSPVIPR